MDLHGAQEEMRELITWSHTLVERSQSFDYSAVRVQTSAPSSPPVPIPNESLAQTRVIRALRTLEPIESAWLRYAYGNREALLEWDDITVVACQVFKQCLAQFDCTPEKQQRLQGLVLPALQQVRCEKNTGKRLYTAAKLIELTREHTQATQGCWKRDFAPFWRVLCTALINLDHVALKRAVGAHDSAKRYANTQMRINVNAEMRLTA